MTLYFAMYYEFGIVPQQRIVVAKREAERRGNVYHLLFVSGLRTYVTTDEVGTLLSDDCAVAATEEEAVAILKEHLAKKAQMYENEAATLRSAVNLKVTYEKQGGREDED